MPKLYVHLFTFPQGVERQHSFLVGSDMGGPIGSIGSVVFDESTTLHQVRTLLETTRDRGMMRRSATFEEILIAMAMPGAHYCSPERAATYRFARPSRDAGGVPVIIPLEEEPNIYASDVTPAIVVVPSAQVGPGCDRCCDGRDCRPCAEATRAAPPPPTVAAPSLSASSAVFVSVTTSAAMSAAHGAATAAAASAPAGRGSGGDTALHPDYLR